MLSRLTGNLKQLRSPILPKSTRSLASAAQASYHQQSNQHHGYDGKSASSALYLGAGLLGALSGTALTLLDAAPPRTPSSAPVTTMNSTKHGELDNQPPP